MVKVQNITKTPKHDAMQLWLHQNKKEMLPQMMRIARGHKDTIFSKKPLKKSFPLEEMQFYVNKIQSEVILQQKTFEKGAIDCIWSLSYDRPIAESEECPISESTFKEVEQLETVGEVLNYANTILRELNAPIYDKTNTYGRIKIGAGDYVSESHKYSWNDDKLNDFETFMWHKYPNLLEWRNKFKTVSFYGDSHFLIEIKPYIGKKGDNFGDTLRQIKKYQELVKEIRLNGIDPRKVIPCLFTLSTNFDNVF